MSIRSLRASKSGNELRRQSTLEPFYLSPFEHHDIPLRGTVSSDFSAQERPGLLGDGDLFADDLPWSSTQLNSAVRGQPSDDNPPPSSSRKSQDSMWNLRNYNFYRWRHASDSQLAAKARAQTQRRDVPPVPALPHEPPLIITTAPGQEEAPIQDKRKSRFPKLSRARSRSRNPAPQIIEPTEKNKAEGTKAGEKRKTVFGTWRHLRPEGGMENGISGRGVHSMDLSTLASSTRLSESSSSLAPPISGQSSMEVQDHLSRNIASDHLTNQPLRSPPSGQSRTWLPHRKKNRQSLFPLPVKIPPPSQVPTAPATPRASTSGISSGSPSRSLGDHSPTPTSQYHPHTDENVVSSTVEARFSHSSQPSSGALAATSVGFAVPGAILGRTRSASGRSDRSAPVTALNPPMPFPLRRGRSATLGSRYGVENGPIPPPTPPTMTGSGRTSTSTAGRSSFSNLLGFGHKLRHGSDPYYSRQGSPGLNGVGSGLVSHTNSFSISRDAIKVTLPERQEGESAGKYLERVEECVDKSQIPAVLAKENDEFYMAVMRSAMRKFAFFGDPLDMSIRKLLMEVDLPKETQQIDRFLQSFADRYHECNPGIFISADKAYFVAFSLLILQTDAFNRNNKRKMTRPDYLKNSNTDGVSEDVLSCFYDNIVYTPFIRVEDDTDMRASKRKSKKILSKPGTVETLKSTRQDPIDPYELIMHGKLDMLRPSVKDVVNLEDPYSYTGTAPKFDAKAVQKFSKAGILQIESERSRPDAFLSPTTIENPDQAKPGLIDLPVDKIGILWRKDPKKKAARSPWQEWGAILTGSGLSFFKNSGWVKNLMHQQKHHAKHNGSGSVIFRPPIQSFKPEYLLPTENAVALHDRSYKRHKNAFVFFSVSGGEEVLLADDESELNDWLARLNHQASYRTAGIRPRGLIGGNYEGQRQRALRRLESSNSTQTIQTPTGEVTIQSGNIDFLLAQQISMARRDAMATKIEELEDLLGAKIKELDNQLRDLRHLLVLAPIQQKSREQLVHSAGRISAKLKWVRIEIWRMKCHRDILALDLDDENTMAGTINRSPKLTPTQLSPVQSNGQSNEKLARVGGTLHLGTSLPTDLAAAKQPDSPPGSPVTSARPDTTQTSSSRGTDPSDEDHFKTPLENTPQQSPSFSPISFGATLSVDRTPSRGSIAAALSLVDQTSRRPSAASIPRSRPLSQVSDASGYTTPLADGETLDLPTKASGIPTSSDGRPATASESETEQSNVASSPESRRGARRSLHRTLRDSQKSLGHHRSRKGRDSSSSIGAAESARLEAPEVEKLARTHGSFTLHGKKASVVTFGSEWQDMLAEERLKLRKEAHNREAQGTVLEDEDGETQPQRTLRTASLSSIQTSPSVALRRASVVASDHALRIEPHSSTGLDGRPFTATEPERLAVRNISSPSTLGSASADLINGSSQGDAVKAWKAPNEGEKRAQSSGVDEKTMVRTA